MLEPKFGEAFALVPTPRVLGWHLRPFSLWHRLLLEEIDSPLVRLPTKANPTEGLTGTDLLRIAAICRNRYPCVRIAFGPLGRLYTAAQLAGRVPAHLVRLRTYLTQALANPEYAIHPPRGGTRGPQRGSAPEVFRMFLSVLAHSRNIAEAWDCPAGQAAWYHAEALRAKGVDVDYVTEEQRQRERQWAAANPEAAAKCRAVAAQWDREHGGGR